VHDAELSPAASVAAPAGELGSVTWLAVTAVAVVVPDSRIGPAIGTSAPDCELEPTPTHRLALVQDNES
jgi:hypothetical protein